MLLHLVLKYTLHVCGSAPSTYFEACAHPVTSLLAVRKVILPAVERNRKAGETVDDSYGKVTARWYPRNRIVCANVL